MLVHDINNLPFILPLAYNDCLYFSTYRSTLDKGMMAVDRFEVPFDSSTLELLNLPVESVSITQLFSRHQVNQFFGHTDNQVDIRITRDWCLGLHTNRELVHHLVKTNEIAAAIIRIHSQDYNFTLSIDPIDNRAAYHHLDTKIDQLIPLIDVLNNSRALIAYPSLTGMTFVERHIDDPNIDCLSNPTLESLILTVRINRGDVRSLVKLCNQYSVAREQLTDVFKYIRVTEHNPRVRIDSLINLYLRLENRYLIHLLEGLVQNEDPEITDLIIGAIQSGRINDTAVNVRQLLGYIKNKGHLRLITRLYQLGKLNLPEIVTLTSNVSTLIGLTKLSGNPVIDVANIGCGMIAKIVIDHTDYINQDLISDYLSSGGPLVPIYNLIALGRTDILRLIPIELIYHRDQLLAVRLIKIGARWTGLSNSARGRTITDQMVTFMFDNGYQLEEYPSWLFNNINDRSITQQAISMIRERLNQQSVARRHLDELLINDDNGLDLDYHRATEDPVLLELINSTLPDSLRLATPIPADMADELYVFDDNHSQHGYSTGGDDNYDDGPRSDLEDHSE